jgi:hypothetical protein
LIYSLKQASWTWYQKLDACFDEIGLKRMNADNCVYHRQIEGKVLLITVYVDDLIILSNNAKMLNELKGNLNERCHGRVREVHFA